MLMKKPRRKLLQHVAKKADEEAVAAATKKAMEEDAPSLKLRKRIKSF